MTKEKYKQFAYSSKAEEIHSVSKLHMVCKLQHLVSELTRWRVMDLSHENSLPVQKGGLCIRDALCYLNQRSGLYIVLRMIVVKHDLRNVTRTKLVISEFWSLIVYWVSCVILYRNGIFFKD